MSRATMTRIEAAADRSGLDPGGVVADATESMLTAVRASSGTFDAHWYPEDPYVVDPGAYRRGMDSEFDTGPEGGHTPPDGEALTVRVDEATATRMRYIRQHLPWWDDVRVVAASMARWTSARRGPA